MICAVIKGPTFEDASQQISQAIAGDANLVELRLDAFKSLDASGITQLRSKFSIPMIFTLRSTTHGGSCTLSEHERLNTIQNLASLIPEYLDIESHVPSEFIKNISCQYPKIKLMLSFHDFNQTPHDLEAIYQQMQKISADLYKVAVKANSTLDAFRLLCWSYKKPKLVAVSMGSHGYISRILGPVIGSPISYACLQENLQSAPGQIPLHILKNQYRYHTLNPETAIYGLIGDPVEQSVSHHSHNALMKASQWNAIYIKMVVKPDELEQFLQLAKKLPIRGLSVTMPLKEKIIPFLDQIDPPAKEMGAVNTLHFNQGKITGYNTDAMGALNALEEYGPVKGKRIIMIGAGGAAKAIAYEAYRRGGELTIVNRDVEKAEKLAKKLHAVGKGLDYMAECFQTGYDILINTTPLPLPIDPQYIIPHTLVMDIKTQPKVTPFLQHALDKQCQVVYGYRMFVEQAIGQYNIWFKEQNDPTHFRAILEQKVLEILS